MFLIIAILALSIVLINFSKRTLKRAELRRSLNLIDELSPRLKISVVACGPRSITYIASLLLSESSAYQVIIVDDFSRNQGELNKITRYFGLLKTNYTPTEETPEGSIRALYRSHKRLFAKVVVVDSPKSKSYTPFEVGAEVSSYNYNLQIRSKRGLQPQAIEELLLEIAIRPEGSIEKITSCIGERFTLIYREAALHNGEAKIEVKNNRHIKISYRVLK